MGKKKAKKQKRKVKLPVDRHGMPIEPGDTLAWDDGDTLVVSTMTYYGPGFEHVGCWDAMDSNEKYTDNLAMSLNVTKAMRAVKNGR